MCGFFLYATTCLSSVLLVFMVEKELLRQLVCTSLYILGAEPEELQGSGVDQWTLLTRFSGLKHVVCTHMWNTDRDHTSQRTSSRR